jgi:hypothetical protein
MLVHKSPSYSSSVLSSFPPFRSLAARSSLLEDGVDVPPPFMYFVVHVAQSFRSLHPPPDPLVIEGLRLKGERWKIEGRSKREIGKGNKVGGGRW